MNSKGVGFYSRVGLYSSRYGIGFESPQYFSGIDINRPCYFSKSGGAALSSFKSSVALRMSVIHVTTFIACWTPFLFIQLWHIADTKSVEEVSPIVQDILFLLAYLNSCLNPIVYGGFYFKNFRKNSSLIGLVLNHRTYRYTVRNHHHHIQKRDDQIPENANQV